MAELILAAGFAEERALVKFSGLATTRLRCDACGAMQRGLRWLRRLDDELGRCNCGGIIRAVPFYCFDQIAAADLAPWLDVPLSDWGIEPQSVVALAEGNREISFLLVPARCPVSSEPDQRITSAPGRRTPTLLW